MNRSDPTEHPDRPVHPHPLAAPSGPADLPDGTPVHPTDPADTEGPHTRYGNNRKLLVVTALGVATIISAVMLSVPGKSERVLTEAQAFNTLGRPTLGDPKRGGEVILFADYSCPGCREFEELQLKGIKKALIDTGLAHLVFMQSPFINKSSDRAALAAECVYRTAGNDTFWLYTKALYDQQGREPADWATDQLLRTTAEDLKVDLNRYGTCLKSQAAKDAVASDLAQHRTAGMQGTPTVFVNGYRTPPGGQEIFRALQDHDSVLNN